MAHQKGSGPVIGLTGARFGGRYADVDDDRPTTRLAMPAQAAGGAPVVGLTGARFGGPSRRRRRAAAAQPAVPVPDPPVVPAPEPVLQEAAPEQSPSMSVRPYVLTCGRTRSELDLALETLVSAVAGAPGDPDIVELCRQPRSVAEIAALRRLPLGVVKVLLCDLAASGAIAVHRSAAAGPDLALMQRVLHGLRRL
jgi:Protein of unknown function (DUF742)